MIILAVLDTNAFLGCCWNIGNGYNHCILIVLYNNKPWYTDNLMALTILGTTIRANAHADKPRLNPPQTPSGSSTASDSSPHPLLFQTTINSALGGGWLADILAMEYLPSLQQEFDELKPSLFGKLQCSNGSDDHRLIAQRTPRRTATVRPSTSIHSIYPRGCHSPPSSVSSADTELLR